MRPIRLLVAAATLVTATAAGLRGLSSTSSASTGASLAEVRAATAPFRDPDTAIAAGSPPTARR